MSSHSDEGCFATLGHGPRPGDHDTVTIDDGDLPNERCSMEVINLGHLRQRSCSRKRGHETEREPWHEYIRVKERTGVMVAYSCAFCAGWHLGHVRRNPIYGRIPELLPSIGSHSIVPEFVCINVA
jgi:hypothetical protein